MSRVAKKPVALPKGVECKFGPDDVTVKGPKGTLKLDKMSGVELKLNGAEVVFTILGDNGSMAGTARALFNNMVKGVSEGYQKKLELVGVGYRAAVQAKSLTLTLGFSHLINFAIPDGITIEAPSQTEIIVKGIDRQRVGQTAAEIRGFRPPEPYKGKGVKYSDEKISLKEAKKK
jgi:large subunit ribosomal protein L6